MSNKYSTIEEYISGFDNVAQGLLKQLKSILDKCVPKEATETISYQMPTYRYNGNLIHFAMNKNHLGLYPGSAAIEAFSDRLTSFKISKGAIQLPLDKPLPEELIRDVVHFNAERLKDQNNPKWDAYRSNWTDCYELMEQIVAKTELSKAFKWGTSVYTYREKNVVSWGGFKHFFSIWFYNGVFLEDRDKVLVTASEGKTKGMRQWRFSDVKEMDEKKILAYIKESIQVVKDGKEIKAERATLQNPTGLLKEALNKDKAFKEAFEKLTSGRQREYITYIEEPKQEKTKQSRLDKAIPLILGGKGLYDKYKK